MKDHLRAAFVLLHLLAVALLCVPAPVGVLNKRTYNDPAVQGVFEHCAEIMQRLGHAVSRSDLQDQAWETGQRMLALRRTLIRPYRPYTELTGTQQGWSMFGTVNRAPARLEVHVQHSASPVWVPLYVMRSSQHDWRRRTLDQERVRGLFNDFSHLRRRRRFRQVAAWFATEVLGAQPSVQRVRVSMVVLPSPDPGTLRAEGRVAPGERRWSTTIDRNGDSP